MSHFIRILAVAALSGCGVDNMGAAATAATLKKQEIEQGGKIMEQVPHTGVRVSI